MIARVILEQQYIKVFALLKEVFLPFISVRTPFNSFRTIFKSVESSSDLFVECFVFDIFIYFIGEFSF